jgi:hypothetical protein
MSIYAKACHSLLDFSGNSVKSGGWVGGVKYVFLVVIDRKRIFLFRPKTNIRQENAAEYSADNEYSAQGSKHYKKFKFA